MQWYPEELQASTEERFSEFPPTSREISLFTYLGEVVAKDRSARLPVETNLMTLYEHNNESWDFLFQYEEIEQPEGVESLVELLMEQICGVDSWGPEVLDIIEGHPLGGRLVTGLRAEKDFSVMMYMLTGCLPLLGKGITTHSPSTWYGYYEPYTGAHTKSSLLTRQHWEYFLRSLFSIANSLAGVSLPMAKEDIASCVRVARARQGSAILLQAPDRPMTLMEETIRYRLGYYLGSLKEADPGVFYSDLSRALANILENYKRGKALPNGQLPKIHTETVERRLRLLFGYHQGNLSQTTIPAMPSRTPRTNHSNLEVDILFYALCEREIYQKKRERTRELIEEIGKPKIDERFVDINSGVLSIEVGASPKSHTTNLMSNLTIEYSEAPLPHFPKCIGVLHLGTPFAYAVPFVVRRTEWLSLEFCIPITTKTQNILLKAYGVPQNNALRPLTGIFTVFKNKQLGSSNPQEYLADWLSSSAIDVYVAKVGRSAPLSCNSYRLDSVYNLIGQEVPANGWAVDNTFAVFEMVPGYTSTTYMWAEYFNELRQL